VDAVVAGLQTWAGAAGSVGIECVSEAGPGRALSFGRSVASRVQGRKQSMRLEDAASLKDLLQKVDQNKQADVEVVGPKGIGKSVLIDTVLAHKACLVEMDVGPGENKTYLVAAVHRRIRGYRALGKSDGDAKRVMFWFHALWCETNIDFSLRERSAGDKFAQITSSTRTLVGEGYRTIIDASPNSVEPEAMATERQLLLEMEAMSREVVMREPEFMAMFERLEGVRADKLVWQTLGGVPALLVQLASSLRNAKEVSVRPIVEKMVGANWKGAWPRGEMLNGCEDKVVAIVCREQPRSKKCGE
jgi:hypothetical protein